MKPKIIFSNFDDINNPYFGGGGAIATHQIAKRLVEKYDVKVITGKYPGSKDEVMDGVKYQRVGLSFFLPQITQAIYTFNLPMLVKKENYDLWFECFTPPISTNFLPLFTKRPVIGVVHILCGKEMRRKYRLPFDLFEKLGIKTYRNIITTSEYLKNKINKLNSKSNVVVIPNGVESVLSRRFVLGKYILFMGRIEVGQKGLDLLLKSFARISEVVKYPLYIAGSGEKLQMKKLNRLINSLKLQGRVKVLGKVGGLEKAELYKGSAFVVIPSRFETFSMVALEALSYGKPVLSFDIDGLRWMPQGCGVKINKFSSQEMSEEILKLSNNPQLLEIMGEVGVDFAKDFTWDSIALQYDLLISQLLNENYSDLLVPAQRNVGWIT
jgi:phosphatidyl-myo-inositol alpha-mannosyltransferase